MLNKKASARAAVLDGCNTSQDVADETGIDVNQCSSYLAAFVRKGWLRKTRRTMPNIHGCGRPLIVFEVIP